MERERAAARDRAGGVERAARGAKHETVIVFDWDDTVLPTSWLERLHAAACRGQPQPRAERYMAELCDAASETLRLAETLGEVIFITNSAPGWVLQSCQQFMPQLLPQMREYDIYAKPMNAPITFKTGAFQRECKPYRNVVSVGDGDAERAASLHLQAEMGRRGSLGGDGQAPQLVKSVKLLDFPTCQQLIAQHDMLQAKLAEVVAASSSLDLKARVPGAAAGAFRAPATEPLGRGREAGACQLVHFAAQRPLRYSDSTAALPPLGRGGDQPDAEGPSARDGEAARAASAGEAAQDTPRTPSAGPPSAEESPGNRAARLLPVGPAPGAPRAVALGSPGAWKVPGVPGVPGEARGGLLAAGAPKKQQPAALPQGLGAPLAAGGAAWRKQPRGHPLHVPSRVF